ncbi:MAG: gamma-glutamyltransferase [Verrucomicrobiota bacterium]
MMPNPRYLRASLIGCLVLLQTAVLYGQIDTGAIIAGGTIFKPVVAENGMVSTAEALATQVGLDVLKDGGNAVDAGVAVGMALAVTLPRAGNIGGGGFMIIHDAKSGETVALDFREKAPKAAFRDMFLDEEGNADPKKSRFSYLASGVPGTVRGLALAAEKWGSKDWDELVEPAIKLAEDGFPVYTDLASSLKTTVERKRFNKEAYQTFTRRNGKLFKAGDTLKQPDLAKSLKQIAKDPDAFYTGDIAEKIAKNMDKNGGMITLDDLASYQPAIRKPITGDYRGYTIASMPPPSSGGVHIVQMLNILEPFPLGEWGHNTAKTVHHIVETMRLAYADRSKHLGDSDFVDVPIEGLTSVAYADDLRSKINPLKATRSTEIGPGAPQGYESDETTHFSVIDKEGNAISCTYTLNFSYGSGIMIPGTGILMNNEMDDFSAKPGVPNAYGLIGGEFNAVEPGKRMLSSMSPSIVLKDSEVFLATGSPGGSRIITATMQVIMNVIDHQMNPAEADSAVRFHHQWYPDMLWVERGFPGDSARILGEMGHKVETRTTIGATQTILRSDGVLYGSSDPRRSSGAVMGY